jgi:hypothetical protein
VRAAALQALGKLAAAAPPVAEALLASGAVDAVALGLAPGGPPAVQAAAADALTALARAGGSGAPAAIVAAGAGPYLLQQLDQASGAPAAREAAVRCIEALIVADASLAPLLVGGESLTNFVALLVKATDGSSRGGGSRSASGCAGAAAARQGREAAGGGATALRLQHALLSCLCSLCALGPAAAEAAARAGVLHAATSAAAHPSAPAAARTQALSLLAHAAHHSPDLARAALAAGGAKVALEALPEPHSAQLRAAGATLLLELCRRSPETAEATIGTLGAAPAIAQYLDLESAMAAATPAASNSAAAAMDSLATVAPSMQQARAPAAGEAVTEGGASPHSSATAADGTALTTADGEDGYTHKLGPLLAGVVARGSPALARSLVDARVPHLLVRRLRRAGAPEAGAAAWALLQVGQQGPALAGAVIDAGALPALVAAYARLSACVLGAPAAAGPGATSMRQQPQAAAGVPRGAEPAGCGPPARLVKTAAKALIRGCRAAAALEPLVSPATPPRLLRHVLERLTVLLSALPGASAAAGRCCCGGDANSSRADGSEGGAAGAAAARHAFVAAGGLARLQAARGVAGGSCEAGGDGARLQQRLDLAADEIAGLFPGEVVAYYAAAVGACGADTSTV